MRGQRSPKFARGGRGTAGGRDETTSGGVSGFIQEEDLSRNYDKYKTITVREDDEFYRAYIDMQANSKYGSPEYGKTDRRWVSDRKARDAQGQDTYLTTSRFGDSDKGMLVVDDASSDVIAEEQSEFWFERRNRFLDLDQYVRCLRSRIVRTPEDEERVRRNRAKLCEPHARQRGRSFSPLASQRPRNVFTIPTRQDADIEGVFARSKVLNHVKLLRPSHLHSDKKRVVYYARKRLQPDIMLLRPDGRGFINKYPNQHVITEKRPQPDISRQQLVDL